IKELAVALQQLAADQREALILVGAMGLSYEEAADICGCAIGTIKSRVNRARAKLVKTLQYGELDLPDEAVVEAGSEQRLPGARPV
uniref:sigma factor-like helix-turn-helix DNA-binding protein n=1 Tax=Salmonella sp. M132 TaxID=3240287 RepID=UPI00352ADD3E